MQFDLEQTTSTRPYDCPACHTAFLATVRSYGIGVGSYGTSRENAQRDGEDAVFMLLKLANCPRCGHHDTTLAARNARTRTIAIVSMGAIFALTAIALFVISPLFALIGSAIFAICLLPLRKAMLLRYPTDASAQVTFAELPAAKSAPVPAALARQTHQDGGWKWI
jgi:hypothetical protein